MPKLSKMARISVAHIGLKWLGCLKATSFRFEDLKATQKDPKKGSKWRSYGKNQYQMELRASKPWFLSVQTPLAQPHFSPLSRRFCIVTTKIGFRIGFYNTNSTLTSYICINALPSILPACQRLKVDFVLVFDSPNGPRRIANLTMYCKLQYQMSVRGSLYRFLSIQMALGNAHFIRLTGSMVVKQEFGLQWVDSFESYPLSNLLNHTPKITDQLPTGQRNARSDWIIDGQHSS